MGQITLEQAAEKYGELNGIIGEMGALASAFEAGAGWQKEQYKDVLNALQSLYNSIDSCIELTPELLFKAKAIIEKFK